MKKYIEILSIFILFNGTVCGQAKFSPNASDDVRISLQNMTLDMPSRSLNKLDSLYKEKVKVLRTKIKDLEKNFGLRSTSSEDYSKKTEQINQQILHCSQELTNPAETAWLQDHLGQLNQLENALNQFQDKLPDVQELETIKTYQSQLLRLSQQSQGYFQEVQNILGAGFSDYSPLMQQLESKIGNHKEFQELQRQTTELERLKSETSEYQDQEYVKMKALEQAKKLVSSQINKRQGKIQSAQKQLAAYKKKYSSIQSTKDMSTAVKRNSLEGKPLSERLVLGGTFQINRDPTALDLSPLLGYRINKKFTLGIGATYRAILDFDEFETEDPVYGYRGYLQREAYKGFFVHGEYERMSNIIKVANTTDEPTRQWVSGGLIGVGKEYGFVKGIKGQVMVLYNFLHEHEVSPYQKPWVLQFGFVLED